MLRFEERLAARSAGAGVAALPAVAQRCSAYFDLLRFWNRKINLTGFDLEQPSDEALDRLFVEPLLAAREFSSGLRIIDVGSGGGSPAIPFSAAVDATRLVMVESRQRKSTFLREALRVAQLPGSVETARAEALVGQDDIAGSFDVVTIRAVAVTQGLSSAMLSFLRAGGRVCRFKGPGEQPSGWGAFQRRLPLLGGDELELIDC